MITKKRSEISDQEWKTYTGIVLYESGSKAYYLNGQRHRTDGPAGEDYDGSKFWFLHGQRHRLDGPAVEYSDGSKAYFLNGKTHRTDGPAVEYANGTKFWYYQGQFIKARSQKEFESWLKNKGIDIPTKTINSNTTPINNHICLSCGNTRCNKQEKSCWLCGTSLQ